MEGEAKRRTHTKSAMPAYPPPPIARNKARKKYANQPGAMSVRELRKTLQDYYAYHDPFKTTEDIDNIIKWAKKKGIKRLNEKLRNKYGEDLETREEELKMRSRVLSRLITPGIVENYQQDDYESDEEDAFSSVSNNFQRKEVRERSSSIVQDSSMKKRVEHEIDAIEKSFTPAEIRNNLINFYKVVAPQRLETVDGDDPPFLEEILTWTFRFGLPALANNLRVKYLGYEEEGLEEEQDNEAEEEMLELQGIGLGNKPEPQFEETNKQEENEMDYPTESKFDPGDAKLLAEKLTAFYNYYNPARIANGVDDLVQYVQKKGVEALNKKLRGRYNDDLNTFTKQKKDNQTTSKQTLFEKLFQFYTKHDPTKVGGGLSRIISWTERNGYDALNQQLRDAYGTDLTELS